MIKRISGAVELPSPMAEEAPVLAVDIRDVAERRLVTIIEIPSSGNKRGEGAHEYAERRMELLDTHTHLREIDLLGQGMRIQLPGAPPPAPYYVYRSRWQRRPYTQIWPISLQPALTHRLAGNDDLVAVTKGFLNRGAHADAGLDAHNHNAGDAGLAQQEVQIGGKNPLERRLRTTYSAPAWMFTPAAGAASKSLR